MRLIVVRHGQTEENTKGIIQGPLVPLDGAGKKQAEMIAERLKDEKIDVAYVSDYKRTIDTVDVILQFHPETVVIRESALREKNTGIFVGRPNAEQKKAREESGLSFYEFKPEGGESLVDLQNRVLALYEKVVEQHPNKTVLFVTHNGVIKTLLLHLMKKTFIDWESINVPNTAITVIDVSKLGQNEIKTLNSSEHLSVV